MENQCNAVINPNILPTCSGEMPKPEPKPNNNRVSQLAAAYFNSPVTNKAYGIHWPAHCVALIPYNKKDEALMQIIEKKVLSVLPVSDFFNDFKSEEGYARLFTHIGNGIGDIFAFSAMANYLQRYPLQIHVAKRFHPIFKWFKRELTLKDYFESIADDFTPANRLMRYKFLNRLPIENAAVEAGTDNWIDAHFKRIGIDAAPEGYCRPMLKTERISTQKPKLIKKSVLICNRSSCQMRSSTFEDFYLPTVKAFPNHKIYVHDSDLRQRDYDFIKQNDIQVTVLPKCSISDFLLNVYDAGIVISTDSGAIHFREGVEKPGLAVFGAMKMSSRMSGYKFTKGFDVKTGCPFQPCVIHEKVKGEVCKNADVGDTVARCQSGKSFQNQLYKELKKML